MRVITAPCLVCILLLVVVTLTSPVLGEVKKITVGSIAQVPSDGEGGLGYLMVYNGVSHLIEMTPHEDDPFAYKRYSRVYGVVAYDYTSYLCVWATFNEYNDVWLYWRSNNAWYWIRGLNLTQITAGEAGVWGVTSDNSLYYRAGTAGGCKSLQPGTDWVNVDGDLTQVSSGNDVVMGVTSENAVYMRDFVNSQNPTGTEWLEIYGLQLNQVDTYGNVAWGVYEGDVYYIRL
nr:hypothetical protein BaRGS_006248 [Batillaria attramentaria]